jgi:integrase/recombinase XerD
MQTRLPPSSIISSQTARTRPPPNCRRAALHSFFKHLLRNDLARSLQYTRVLAIPSKKAEQSPATYLEADDVRAIIAKPDRRTDDGWRDYTLLLFFYNCGARVSEAIGVRWTDLQLVPPRQVRLRGKGRKERLLPLWRETAGALHRLRGMPTSAEKQHVFVNQHGQPLSRDGIAYMRKYVSEVTAEGHPTLARKPSRHTCFAIAVLWRCCNPAPTSP